MKLMTVADLATQIGIDRSSALRRVKKLGIQTTKEYRMTDRGLSMMSCIPLERANEVIETYRQARILTECDN